MKHCRGTRTKNLLAVGYWTFLKSASEEEIGDFLKGGCFLCHFLSKGTIGPCGKNGKSGVLLLVFESCKNFV